MVNCNDVARAKRNGYKASGLKPRGKIEINTPTPKKEIKRYKETNYNIHYEETQQSGEGHKLIKTPSSPKASITNIYGSTKGEKQLILNSDNSIFQHLDLMDGHLHEAYTQTAFLMNNNPETEMTLSADAQRFDESFDRLNANKTAESEEIITKDEFFAFLQDYSREAVDSGTEGDEYRNKIAVHLDETNKQELELAFNAIAGENGQIEKQEFVDFWNEVMQTGEQYTDPATGKTMTKVTGENLNNIVNTRLEARGELPTFRKSEEEIQQLLKQEKENELKGLKIDINSDFVSKIEYNKDKSVSFITLDDETQLQIQNKFNQDKNGIQITKEGERFVITNNSSNQLEPMSHRITIKPTDNSKITLRDCSGITFSSQGDMNDDVVIEGNAEKINLNFGGGVDKYKDHTDHATTYNQITKVKSSSNDSIKLTSEKDIAYTNTTSSKGTTKYYSVNDDDTKGIQEKELNNTRKTLEKTNDTDLLKIILFDSIEDAGDISVEDLIKKAKEMNIEINEQVQNGSKILSDKTRQEIIDNYISSKEDTIKNTNQESKKAEKEATQTYQQIEKYATKIKKDRKELERLEKIYNTKASKKNPDQKDLDNLQKEMDKLRQSISNNKDLLGKFYE